MKVFIVVALFFSVCSAASLDVKEGSSNSVQVQPSDQDHSASGEVKKEHVARYTFEWAVKDDKAKLDFGHQETRDGDLTSGIYRVLLPNSVIQTVNYTVDGHNGYVAEVSNEEVEVKEEAVVPEGEENGEENGEKSHGKEESKYHH